MPPRDETEFLAAVASMRPHARRVVDPLAGRTRVRILERTSCGGRASCALGTIVEQGDERTSSFEVELLRATMDGSLGARFLTVHELAHLVEYDLFDASDRTAIERTFRRSPRWRACFLHQGSCLEFSEVFADQFAMYALREPRSMTTYAVPRLLTDAAFEALLVRHAG